MSGHWWRAYDEAVDDPKLQMLPDRLFRGWFNLCCLTSANGGTLPSMEVMAFKLRLTPAKVTKLIEELRGAILIDEDGQGVRPHNWNGRQFKSDVTDPTAAERMTRHRNKTRNGTVTNTVTKGVTVTDPETDTEAETEKKKDGASAPPIDPDADLFRRGKEVLGADAGSLIARLKKSKGGSIAHTRAVIEQASTKQNPREYVGRVMNGPAQATTPNGTLWPEGIT